MWAMSDFNGATLIVPGSHRWAADGEATADAIISAEMPAGSILLWAGGPLHGAGQNRSNDWRHGVILTYALGCLRQEENQHRDVPLHLAEKLSPELRAVIGDTRCDNSLGLYDPSIR